MVRGSPSYLILLVQFVKICNFYAFTDENGFVNECIRKSRFGLEKSLKEESLWQIEIEGERGGGEKKVTCENPSSGLNILV